MDKTRQRREGWGGVGWGRGVGFGESELPGFPAGMRALVRVRLWGKVLSLTPWNFLEEARTCGKRMWLLSILIE